jgi:DNA-binding transcriptional ArsR family regulator
MMEEIQIEDGAEPADQLVVHDPATLKVLSNPLRVEIVRQLSEPRTVTEVAERLEYPRTKLYYHINLLEEHGLIRVVGSNLVSGIVEKQYQIAAREFRVDRALLAGGSAEEMHEVLRCMFDDPRQEVRRSVEAGLLDFDKRVDAGPGELALMPQTHLLARLHVALTPAQFKQYHQRLMAIVNEMGEMERQAPPGAEEGRAYGLLLAFYPLAGAAADLKSDEE